jgi:hypothetical protein
LLSSLRDVASRPAARAECESGPRYHRVCRPPGSLGGLQCFWEQARGTFDPPVSVDLQALLAEGFFGLLKRERVNRRQYQTRSEARADVFDYIERFHNPRRTRRTEQRTKEEAGLTQPSVEQG